MTDDPHVFPRKLFSANPIAWPEGIPPDYDDAAILARLDGTHADMSRAQGAQGVKPWNSLTETLTALIAESDLTSALRLSLLPADHLRHHPFFTNKRLKVLSRLAALPALEAEARRFLASPQMTPDLRASVQTRMLNTGLAWRMADCLPEVEPLFADLHLPAMDWLAQPSALFGKTEPRIAQARSALNRALNRPETTATTAAFDRADRIRTRFRWLTAAVNVAQQWPDDPMGQRITAFHDAALTTLLHTDLSPLAAARDQGLSPIVLFSHLAPQMGMPPLLDLGLPVTLIAGKGRSRGRIEIVSTSGTQAEVNLRFLALAKRMTRAQTVLAIYPDFAKHTASPVVPVLGIPCRISVGAAALARRRPSQFFYADTRILADRLNVTMIPGPRLGAEIPQAEAEALMLQFYVGRLSHNLGHPPGQIASPLVFAHAMEGDDA